MNPNDVVLIYADHNKKDIGVLQDYSFDMCYGDSENNFECRVQRYNQAAQGVNAIWEDYILYIEFTEYGGIVDKVEVDTKTNELIYSGRSWHGLLNSFVIEPKKGKAYRYYKGEANAVLAQIISDIGMTRWFTVEDTDSGIKIKGTNVRYEKAYDCIMKMLAKADAKLVMWYQSTGVNDGKIHIEAVSRVNTGAFDEFDTSQTPFKAGKAYNKVNDLICLGQGNGTKRAVIHLYTDENGGILPFCRSNPLEDSDYYTDLTALSRSTDVEDMANYAIISASRVTGTKRYVEIYDHPNSEIKINYRPLSDEEIPEDWMGTYTDYYYRTTENGNTVYKQFKKTYKDEYVLTDLRHKGEPLNWRSNYKDYYVKKKNTSKAFKKVTALSDSQVSIKYRPNLQDDNEEGMSWVDPYEWEAYFVKGQADGFDGYYQKAGMYGEEWEEVPAEKEISYKEFYNEGDPPFDWDDNFGSYYLRSWDGTKWEYYAVPGDQEQSYTIQTKEPTDWADNYNHYYFKATQKVVKDNKVVIKKGLYYSVADGISSGLIDEDHWATINIDSVGDGSPRARVHLEYPKWRKKTFYTLSTKTLTPEYVDGTVYYKVEKLVPPTFVSGKYYKKIVDNVPPWQPMSKDKNGFGGYWEKVEDVEQIPNPKFVQPYKKVEDRFAELCKVGVEKLEELSDTDTLDVSLELEEGYDVGDIVGAVDIETGIDVAKPILRKIIKIKKDILSVDYEVE